MRAGAAFAWAGVLCLAASARGLHVPSAGRASAFAGRSPSAAPGAAARRPHRLGLEPVGAKPKKRKFRGGLDWDDARLYDEWIKAGAPEEFDFTDIEEIDLESGPPDPALSLLEEELLDAAAEQILTRPPTPQREPAPAMAASGGRRVVDEPGPEEEAAAPSRRKGRGPERASEAAEDAAIAATLKAMPRISSNWMDSGADEGAMGSDGEADSAGAVRTDASASGVAGGEAAGLGLSAVGPDKPDSPFDMPGWVQVGHAWTRSGEPPEPAPGPRRPKFSVPVPASMKTHILAREAGEVVEQVLWPDSNWRAAWATAVDDRTHRGMVMTYANFNIKISTNFPDVPALAGDSYGIEEAESGASLTIGDEALMKAEMAFRASGLPSIAEATSVELLANPNARNDKRYVFRGEVRTRAMCPSTGMRCRSPPPRVRLPPAACCPPIPPFSPPPLQINERVDELMLKLRPLSAPNRVALFHSVTAFVNGTHR
ncbi:hypothetical protein T492DRAFT_358470 [Pavlovales sp. CCMP2436]|nr:hypothetical protein T492DRAFT_358470 [Pavlovales sp. CCMP2436]